MEYPHRPHFVHQWLDYKANDDVWREAQVLQVNEETKELTLRVLDGKGSFITSANSNKTAPYRSNAVPFSSRTPDGKYIKDWRKVSRPPIRKGVYLLALNDEFEWRAAYIVDLKSVPGKPSLKLVQIEYNRPKAFATSYEWIYSNSERLAQNLSLWEPRQTKKDYLRRARAWESYQNM
jgi:hypothetical protein